MMDIVLQEDYPQLGYVGDRVSVKNGFARNFLIPQGIAIEASSRNAKVLEHMMAAIMVKKAKLKSAAEEFAEELSTLRIEFKLKVGAGNKAFGSITSRDIEAALKAKDLKIEKKQIRLAEPIKTVGETKVEIRLHSEVTTEITVDVKGIKEKKKAEDKDVKGRRSRKAKEQQSDDDAELTEEELEAIGEEDELSSKPAQDDSDSGSEEAAEEDSEE